MQLSPSSSYHTPFLSLSPTSCSKGSAPPSSSPSSCKQKRHRLSHAPPCKENRVSHGEHHAPHLPSSSPPTYLPHSPNLKPGSSGARACSAWTSCTTGPA